MRAVIQRVRHASVTVHGNTVAEIGSGLLVLIGVTHEDSESDFQWLASKIASLRIFPDQDGKMNLSLQQTGYRCLVVSQFTLYAQSAKGSRPSFTMAATPETAARLYDQFIDYLENIVPGAVEKGVFGADMQVELLNDGPVTILLDSKNRE